MIYDEESDRHVHIPFRQAMRATCYGDANGPKGDIFKLKEALNNATTARNIEDSKQADGYNGAKKAKDLQGTSLSDLVNEVNKEAAARNTQAEQNLANHIIEAVEAGIWMPVEIVIARPFIEHLMLSAVVAVAGRDTGATLFGPADMQISVSLKSRTLSLHRIPAPHAFWYTIRRWKSMNLKIRRRRNVLTTCCVPFPSQANTSVKTIEGHCEQRTLLIAPFPRLARSQCSCFPTFSCQTHATPSR